MRFLITIGVLLFLGACGFTTYGDIASEFGKQKSAQAFDRGLVNAEWFVCSAASIGSIKRRYGMNVERGKAYHDFCTESDSHLITNRKPTQ